MSAELMTVAQACARLGDHVTQQWYVRRLNQRVFPGHKVGRVWMISEADFTETLERLAIPAAEPQPNPWGLTQAGQRKAARRGGRLATRGGAAA